MTHQELIAVLEKATGPSREVDAQIAIAVGIRYRTRKTGGGVSKGREWFEDGHGGVRRWRICIPRSQSATIRPIRNSPSITA